MKKDFCCIAHSHLSVAKIHVGFQAIARCLVFCWFVSGFLVSGLVYAAGVQQGFEAPPAATSKPATTPAVLTPKSTLPAAPTTAGKTTVPQKTTPFRASFSQPKQNDKNQSQPNTTDSNNSFGGTPNLQTLPTNPAARPATNNGFGGTPSVVTPTAGTQSGTMVGNAAPSGLNRNRSSSPANLAPSTNTSGQSPRVASKNSSATQQPITKVSKSFSKLPNSAGQVWREYDITPYTSRITSVENPQQAIVDWILLETGNDMWFHQPLGILSADRHKLYVYHSPEIQAVVNRIVDRMVNTRGQLQTISVNMITIGSPNWRSESYSVMQPIDVRSPGVEAWMVSKENAAYLLANLRRRPDFQEHGNGRLVHHDGQTVRVEKYKPLQFVQNIRWTPNQVPGYQPQLKTIQEGYELTLASLTSLDGKSIEATIECGVDQVEKLRSVKIAIPGAPNGTGAQVNLQIPQMVSWEIKERFRWPNDQVLVLSCGVVANPRPKTNNSLIPDLFEVDRGRADALLFIEYRGPEVAQLPTQPKPAGLAPVQPRR